MKCPKCVELGKENCLFSKDLRDMSYKDKDKFKKSKRISQHILNNDELFYDEKGAAHSNHTLKGWCCSNGHNCVSFPAKECVNEYCKVNYVDDIHFLYTEVFLHPLKSEDFVKEFKTGRYGGIVVCNGDFSRTIYSYEEMEEFIKSDLYKDYKKQKHEIDLLTSVQKELWEAKKKRRDSLPWYKRIFQ